MNSLLADIFCILVMARRFLLARVFERVIVESNKRIYSILVNSPLFKSLVHRTLAVSKGDFSALKPQAHDASYHSTNTNLITRAKNFGRVFAQELKSSLSEAPAASGKTAPPPAKRDYKPPT